MLLGNINAIIVSYERDYSFQSGMCIHRGYKVLTLLLLSFCPQHFYSVLGYFAELLQLHTKE